MYGRKGRDTKKPRRLLCGAKRKKTEIFLLAWHERERAARELKQTHKKLTGNVPSSSSAIIIIQKILTCTRQSLCELNAIRAGKKLLLCEKKAIFFLLSFSFHSFLFHCHELNWCRLSSGNPITSTALHARFH
jgi:hypothetical protein